MLKSVVDLSSQDFSKGLNTNQNLLAITKDQSPNCMDVVFEFDGNVSKRLGTNTCNSVALSATNSAGTLGVTTCGWASFDFGAGNSAPRWLVVAAGTALWASSDLGFSFVRIASDRTSTYQYLERSKNVLVACSEAYDRVLFWSGSAGTFAGMLNISAPLAKYAINYQGFLILLNTSTRKRGFFYEDENSQLTGGFNGVLTTGGNFDMPSSADDEVTGAWVLGRNMYVSTRYKLFQLTYVGGAPDWSYKEIKDWGFVPRTVDRLVVGEVGEILVGESWDRRVRFFDGSEDTIASNNVESDNNMCDFATSKISYSGSGLLTNFGKTDKSENVYKLCTVIGTSSTETTHFLNLEGRTKGFYPSYNNNIKFMSMCMAESGNRQYLMAVDQSGWIHMMNSGNIDRNTYAINEVFNSSFYFDKSPSQTSKSHEMHLFLTPNSSGTLYYSDRQDFSSTFSVRRVIQIDSRSNIVQQHETVDIPISQNIYQYQLSSSSGTNEPWRLNRTDYFSSPGGIGKEIRR